MVGDVGLGGRTLRKDLQPGHPALPASLAQRQIGRDAQEPGPQGPILAQRRAAIQGGDQRVHQDILRRLAVAQDQIGDALDLPAMLLEQIGKHSWLTAAKRLDGQPVSSAGPAVHPPV